MKGSRLPARLIALRAQNIALVLILAMMFAIAWRRTAWVGVIAFLFTQSSVSRNPSPMIPPRAWSWPTATVGSSR